MGYVYLLVHKDGERFKIGKADHLTARISGLGGIGKFDTSRSRVIETPDPGKLERILHLTFDPHRHPALPEDGGTEYFHMRAFDDVVSHVTACQTAFNYTAFHPSLESVLRRERPARNARAVPAPRKPVIRKTPEECAADFAAQVDAFANKFIPLIKHGTVAGCVHQERRSYDAEDRKILLINTQDEPEKKELMHLTHCQFTCLDHTVQGIRGIRASAFNLLPGGHGFGNRNLYDFCDVAFPVSIAANYSTQNPLMTPAFAKLYETLAMVPGFTDNTLPEPVETKFQQQLEQMQANGYEGITRSNCQNVTSRFFWQQFSRLSEADLPEAMSASSPRKTKSHPAQP